MQKLRFLLFFILLPGLLYAQQRTKINLLSSEVVDVDNKTKITHVKKPMFEHDGAILTCDSARLWSELNYFEAFGNVHIRQDTINIYSDLLNYDGNAKMAHLMNRVRMSDPSSTLTTNIFDYDMGIRLGTYLDNGKIVNKKENVTINSLRGYYFANTKDAFFRYNVVVVTDSVTIKSDTLRYNTYTNQTYFYGPTNITGKGDNLYTENGSYNTKTEKAFFGKKNLYTQGTKSLKGDSLYYDGKIGYGKAVKNITFTDSEDKLLMRGQLGEYFKGDERVVVSINAYVGMGTSDSIKVEGKLIPDTLWLGADILEAQKSLQKTLKLIQKPTVVADDEVGVEEENAKLEAEKAAQAKAAPTPGSIPSTSKPPVTKTTPKEDAKKSKKDKGKGQNKTEPPIKISDSLKTSLDSIKPLPDSTKIKIEIKKDSLIKDSLVKDSSLKIVKPLSKDSLKLTVPKTSIKVDTTKVTANKVANTGAKSATPLTKQTTVKDSLPFNPADTVRTRTIRAYHNVKVYKSNLQAKSDSLFFTAADSTLRLYQNPILWSDSSQQSGDTIHVQFKNKKINSAQVFPNAFIADQETDTTKFNQIKGKIITAFFNDGEIRNMYVDGNAESIYFDKKKDGKYQQNQTVSARIRIVFEDKDILTVKTIKGVEGTFLPADKTPKESILTGFVWKPELRPKSKKDIISDMPGKTVSKSKPTVAKPKFTPKTTKQKTTTKPPSTTKKTGNEPTKKVEKLDSNKVTPKPVVPTLKIDTTKKS